MLDIVLALRDALGAGFGLALASTVGFLAVIVGLSVRLRRQELALMQRLGASRARLIGVVAAELALVWVLAVALAAAFAGVGLAVLRSLLPG